MKKRFDDWKNLLYFIIILIVLIFFLVGFLVGYFYAVRNDGSCIENPLSYGVKKINKMNDINLTCSCFSPVGKTNPFSFDEEGIRNEF